MAHWDDWFASTGMNPSFHHLPSGCFLCRGLVSTLSHIVVLRYSPGSRLHVHSRRRWWQSMKTVMERLQWSVPAGRWFCCPGVWWGGRETVKEEGLPGVCTPPLDYVSLLCFANNLSLTYSIKNRSSNVCTAAKNRKFLSFVCDSIHSAMSQMWTSAQSSFGGGAQDCSDGVQFITEGSSRSIFFNACQVS